MGATSGDKYVYQELVNQPGTTRYFSESATTSTQMATYKLERQGSGTAEDDLLLHAVYHITINANGEVTAEVAEVKGECK